MAIRKISVTSGGLTNVAYTSGDVMGNRFSFPNTNDYNEGWTELVGCNIFDDSATLTGAFELYLFAGNVTFGTDNNPPSLTDAELRNNALAVLPFATTDIFVLPNNIMCEYSGKNRFLKPNAASSSADGLALTAHLLARSAPAGFPAATNLQIDLYLRSVSTKES